MRPHEVERRLHPGWLERNLERLLECEEEETPSEHRPATRRDYLLLGPLLTVIVLASVGMVEAATSLGPEIGLPEALVGLLLLSAATGIPNVVGAWRLALHGRGRAVVSESLNSNNANLVGGFLLPAAVAGVTGADHLGRISAVWLLALTGLVLLLAFRRRRFSRREAAVAIGAYAAFVVAAVLLS